MIHFERAFVAHATMMRSHRFDSLARLASANSLVVAAIGVVLHQMLLHLFAQLHGGPTGSQQHGREIMKQDRTEQIQSERCDGVGGSTWRRVDVAPSHHLAVVPNHLLERVGVGRIGRHEVARARINHAPHAVTLHGIKGRGEGMRGVASQLLFAGAVADARRQQRQHIDKVRARDQPDQKDAQHG